MNKKYLLTVRRVLIYANIYVKAEDSGIAFDDVKDTITEIQEWYRVIPIPEPVPIMATVNVAINVIDSLGDLTGWW